LLNRNLRYKNRTARSRSCVIENNEGWLDAPKRLQTETVTELDALLPAILQSSPGFDSTSDHAFKGEL
jgi:hypothetical protein